MNFRFLKRFFAYFTPEWWANWWSAPAGGREIIVLAIPMIISSGSFAIMQFADRVFLTWFSPDAMGAAFSSGQLGWLAASFPFSVAAYTTAFVSQYNGAKQFGRIGRIVWQGIFFGLLLGPVALLAFPLLVACFPFFDHSPALISLERDYLFWSLWGFGPMIANEALSAFFSGRKRMNVVMTVNLVAIAANIVLDYLMIFGVGPLPAMGLTGAALATSFSQWLRFVIFFVLFFEADRKSGGIFGIRSGCRFDRTESFRLFRFGGMGGLQYFVEMVAGVVFILLIGKIGQRENMATAIAFNLNALTFLPIIGTGVAVTTLVGNYLGAERPHLARMSVLSALVFGLIITGVSMVFFLFFPSVLLYPYACHHPAELMTIYDMTVVLLRFVALYIFFDTLNIIFCSALRGAGDTRFVMIVTLIMTPFLVLPAWWIVRTGQFGVYGCWAVLTLWIFTVGCVYAIRFFRGKWLAMRLFHRDGPADPRNVSPE